MIRLAYLWVRVKYEEWLFVRDLKRMRSVLDKKAGRR